MTGFSTAQTIAAPERGPLFIALLFIVENVTEQCLRTSSIYLKRRIVLIGANRIVPDALALLNLLATQMLDFYLEHLHRSSR